VTEKKALGLGPLIGQTVHKIGHNCMDDSAPRSQRFGASSSCTRRCNHYPLRRRDRGSRQLSESHSAILGGIDDTIDWLSYT
jgi:hypothetical protein